MMNRFHFACPGEIFFGTGCVLEHPEIFTRLGKRAYVVCGRFADGVRNLALEDVLTVLDREGITWALDEEVEPDPPVESVVAIRDRALAFRPDFLVAVGGGSTMDTVKALNVLLRSPQRDAYDVLFGEGPHVFGVGGPDEGALPFITVTTTAGTGAEIAGIAVMTRHDLQTKFGTNHRSFADYVFVDSRYVVSCPQWLNHAVALDALCHGIEIYLSRDSRDNFMTNMLSEAAFRLFAQIKEPLLHGTQSPEDYDIQALHSMLQGIVIVNGLTGVPHGMGYPLSYYYHVPHGLACGVFEGEYLRTLTDQARVLKIIEMLGFESVDALCGYIQEMVAMHVDIQVTPSQIEAWTDEFCATLWRVERHPEPLDRETVKGIYQRALERYLVPDAEVNAG